MTSSGSAAIVAGFSAGCGSCSAALRLTREDDAALVDRLDLVGVGEPVAARTGAHVDDHAVEDVGFGNRQDVLHDADLVAVGGHDVGPFREHEIGDGIAEIHGVHRTRP